MSVAAMPRPARLCVAIAVATLGAAGWAAASQEQARSAADEWSFSCGTTPFSLDVFDAPVGAENDDDPAARALRKFLRQDPFGDGAPERGWRVLTRDETYVEYGAGLPRKKGGFPYLGVAKGDEGEGWWVVTFGGCTPATFEEKLNTADWKLADPRSPPSSRDTKVKALLTERACASGQPSDERIRPPRVFYGARKIVILALVEPPPGNAQGCPGNPAAKYTFRLKQPIGDRVLADGAEYPFASRFPDDR